MGHLFMIITNVEFKKNTLREYISRDFIKSSQFNINT